MDELRLSPWMTRREAAEYLRWSVDELDAHLVSLEDNPAQVTGQMRYVVMAVDRDLRVRVLAADVLSILPPPPVRTLRSEREPALVHG